MTCELIRLPLLRSAAPCVGCSRRGDGCDSYGDRPGERLLARLARPRCRFAQGFFDAPTSKSQSESRLPHTANSMSAHWFRFYDSVVDDPKVQRLSLVLFRFWVNILCLSSRNDGMLPPATDLRFSLRMSERTIQDNLAALQNVGLIDLVPDNENPTFEPHNWRSRQFQSDVSTTRVKRFRERRRNVSETPNETDQSQIQTQNRAEQKKEKTDSPSKMPKGDFDAFWTSCPKKVGKAAARKAYDRAMRRTAPETVQAAMSSFAASRAGQDEQYTAHPATWLNHDRWLDEAAKPNGAAASHKHTDRLAELAEIERKTRERTPPNVQS